MAFKYTNRPETVTEDPEFTFVTPEGGKVAGEQFPQYSEGDESVVQAPDKFTTGEDVRTGMNPQDEWSIDKVRNLFPEMVFPEAASRLGVDVAEKLVDQGPEVAQPSIKQPGGEQGAQATSFGPQARDQFEKQWIAQMGANPFLMNPQQMAQQRFQAGLQIGRAHV